MEHKRLSKIIALILSVAMVFSVLAIAPASVGAAPGYATMTETDLTKLTDAARAMKNDFYTKVDSSKYTADTWQAFDYFMEALLNVVDDGQKATVSQTTSEILTKITTVDDITAAVNMNTAYVDQIIAHMNYLKNELVLAADIKTQEDIIADATTFNKKNAGTTNDRYGWFTDASYGFGSAYTIYFTADTSVYTATTIGNYKSVYSNLNDIASVHLMTGLPNNPYYGTGAAAVANYAQILINLNAESAAGIPTTVAPYSQKDLTTAKEAVANLKLVKKTTLADVPAALRTALEALVNMPNSTDVLADMYAAASSADDALYNNVLISGSDSWYIWADQSTQANKAAYRDDFQTAVTAAWKVVREIAGQDATYTDNDVIDVVKALNDSLKGIVKHTFPVDPADAPELDADALAHYNTFLAKFPGLVKVVLNSNDQIVSVLDPAKAVEYGEAYIPSQWYGLGVVPANWTEATTGNSGALKALIAAATAKYQFDNATGASANEIAAKKGVAAVAFYNAVFSANVVWSTGAWAKGATLDDDVVDAANFNGLYTYITNNNNTVLGAFSDIVLVEKADDVYNAINDTLVVKPSIPSGFEKIGDFVNYGATNLDADYEFLATDANIAKMKDIALAINDVAGTYFINGGARVPSADFVADAAYAPKFLAALVSCTDLKEIIADAFAADDVNVADTGLQDYANPTVVLQDAADATKGVYKKSAAAGTNGFLENAAIVGDKTYTAAVVKADADALQAKIDELIDVTNLNTALKSIHMTGDVIMPAIGTLTVGMYAEDYDTTKDGWAALMTERLALLNKTPNTAPKDYVTPASVRALTNPTDIQLQDAINAINAFKVKLAAYSKGLTDANKAAQTAALDAFKALDKTGYTAYGYAELTRLAKLVEDCNLNSEIAGLITALETAETKADAVAANTYDVPYKAARQDITKAIAALEAEAAKSGVYSPYTEGQIAAYIVELKEIEEQCAAIPEVEADLNKYEETVAKLWATKPSYANKTLAQYITLAGTGYIASKLVDATVLYNDVAEFVEKYALYADRYTEASFRDLFNAVAAINADFDADQAAWDADPHTAAVLDAATVGMLDTNYTTARGNLVSVPVITTDLDAALEAAQEILDDTENTYPDYLLEDLVNEMIKGAMAKQFGDQTAIEDATIAIYAAIEDCKAGKIDYSVLEATIVIFEGLDEDDYTALSWAVAKTQYENAKAALEAKTQETVDTANAALADAIKALVALEDFDWTGYNKAVQDAVVIVGSQDLYWSKSVTAVNAALAYCAAAEQYVKSQDDINTLTGLLGAAIENAELKLTWNDNKIAAINNVWDYAANYKPLTTNVASKIVVKADAAIANYFAACTYASAGGVYLKSKATAPKAAIGYVYATATTDGGQTITLPIQVRLVVRMTDFTLNYSKVSLAKGKSINLLMTKRIPENAWYPNLKWTVVSGAQYVTIAPSPSGLGCKVTYKKAGGKVVLKAQSIKTPTLAKTVTVYT